MRGRATPFDREYCSRLLRFDLIYRESFTLTPDLGLAMRHAWVLDQRMVFGSSTKPARNRSPVQEFSNAFRAAVEKDDAALLASLRMARQSG